MDKTKVLIAIDEPELAKKIVHLGCNFLDKNNSEITLINIIENNVAEKEYFFEAPQKFIEHESKKSDFDYLENYLENEGFNYKGFIYKEGNVAKHLLEITDKENYDLIIIGSHNKTPFQRLLLGSVSHKVAMQSKCSTMIVKSFYSPKISEKTTYSALLAVDGSNYSKFVSNNISKFLDSNRAEINIINVTTPIQEIIPPDAYIYTDIDKIVEETKSISNTILRNTAVNVMKQKFNVVRKYSIEGDAADSILNEAENNDNNLIIVGSQGKDSFARWLIGSISYKVYNHSGRPVLIIKDKCKIAELH